MIENDKRNRRLEVIAAAITPRKALTVSQWADTHRELSGKQAG